MSHENWTVQAILSPTRKNLMTVECSGFYGDVDVHTAWEIDFPAKRGEPSPEIVKLIPFLKQTMEDESTPNTNNPVWEELELYDFWNYSGRFEQYAILNGYSIFFYDEDGCKWSVSVK